MMPSQDTVEYEIILKAAQAMATLQQVNEQAGTFKQKVDNVTGALQRFSTQNNLTMKSTISLFKDADDAFSSLQGQSALFGDLQKQGWQEVENGAKKAVGGLHAVRIALGAIVAMIVFQVIQAFQTMFQGVLKGLKEIEAATFNIINAEKKLSEQGIEIDTKSLDELIDKLQMLDPMLSKFQATELVSTLTTKVAPAFGLGTKEIENLAQSITILAVRNQALGKSFEEVEQQVITGLLSGKVTAGINNLGLKITDQIVKEKAIEMQLVKSAKAYDNLSAKEQERVNVLTIMQLLAEDTQTELANLPEFFKSVSGLIGTAQSKFQDILTLLGQKLAPLMKTILTSAIRILEDILTSLEKNDKAWNSWVTLMTIVAGAVGGLIELFVKFNVTVGRVTAAIVELFQKIPILGDIVRNLFPDEIFPDTATASVEDFATAVEEIDTSKLEEVEEIFQDTANAVEDLAEKMTQKLEDIETEYRRKQFDAEVDYRRKLEDIDRDYEREKAELNNKHRGEDLKAEKEYQLKLWELRQRFLMDLEDALHARDARQVLRLQKQYAIDKEALKRKHALEEEEREQGQKEELENLELQRQRKREDAKLEYEQHLADLNLAKQREFEDLQKWYMREFQDLKEAQDRKIKELLEGWAKEQELTEAQAGAVYAILQKYFGPGGYTDELYQYMMGSMISNAQAALAQVSTMMGSIGSKSMEGQPAPEGSLNNNQGLPEGVNPFTDQGGTLLSTRPARSLLGKNVADRVNLKPLNRVDRNLSRMSGDPSNRGGGLNGQIRILVDLSPDLEGRIVEKSMDSVADVFAKVGRMK